MCANFCPVRAFRMTLKEKVPATENATENALAMETG
jgi:formate hydrogenlyase subunit 6/NADH:ubiquinone oxidoreductase subunit I